MMNYILIIGSCIWGAWQDGVCSATCGGGNMLKTRTKILEEKNGGVCEGNDTMIGTCNTQSCECKSLFCLEILITLQLVKLKITHHIHFVSFLIYSVAISLDTRS